MCRFSDNNNKQMPNYWNILYPCTSNQNELGVSESPCGNESMAPTESETQVWKPFSFRESI